MITSDDKEVDKNHTAFRLVYAMKNYLNARDLIEQSYLHNTLDTPVIFDLYEAKTHGPSKYL